MKTSKIEQPTVILYPEEGSFWHRLCDREGIPAGTIKERIKLLIDSHYKLRGRVKCLEELRK